MKRKKLMLTVEITFPHMFTVPFGTPIDKWQELAYKFVNEEVDDCYFGRMIEENGVAVKVVDSGEIEVDVNEEEEFKEWKRKRKLCHDLGRNGDIEDMNGVPGYLYDTYFIHMQESGNFGVILASVERSYETIAEAERCLWMNHVRYDDPYNYPYPNRKEAVHG